MTTDPTQPDLPHTLCCHPATPAPTVRSVEVWAEWRPAGDLFLRYCLRGDMARLLIPEPKNSARTDLLWEHTCFEAFIGLSGSPAYREFNFSPSGQWAAYAFADYRQRVEQPETEAPQITARLFAGRLELDAIVPAQALPDNTEGASWQLGLTAVVEATDTVDGGHSYWALKHLAERPDFHRREAFTLRLCCS